MDLPVRLVAIILLLAGSALAQTVPAATRPKAFTMGPDGNAFTPWGFNYDRDFKMRLIEEYWETEWSTVEQDFREMKELGANVVRIHLQFAQFMEAPGKPSDRALAQLTKLTKLAEDVGLYLDITGLACYRKSRVPAWFNDMSEQDRWAQQTLFWEAIARTCANSPAIFCYNLVNEPVVPGEKVDSWLHPKELAGFSYVQFIVKDPAGRDRHEVARLWVRQMVQSIRKHDKNRLVTLGMLPFPDGAGFAPRDMAKELDYLSIHIYPASDKLDDSIKLLKDFSHGKPVVIEEIFPISCTTTELEQFIRQSRPLASGWIGFYWGRSPAELGASEEIGDRVTLSWLELFQKLRPEMIGDAP